MSSWAHQPYKVRLELPDGSIRTVSVIHRSASLAARKALRLNPEAVKARLETIRGELEILKETDDE